MSASRINKVLKSNSDLGLLVASRISLAPAKQEEKKPFVTYEFQFDDPVKDLQGIASLQRQEWRVSVLSDRYTSAEEVKDAVLSTMLNETTEFRASFQNSEYDFDVETDLHRFSIDFLITYQL